MFKNIGGSIPDGWMEFDRWEFPSESFWRGGGGTFPDTCFVLFIKGLLSLLFVF